MKLHSAFVFLCALIAVAGCSRQDGSSAARAGQYAVADFATDVIARSQTTPVVVDFWASWCGPCKMLKPTIEQAAAGAGDRWKLVAVNVDEHGAIAQQYGIQGIPNVKLFYQGKIVAEFTGMKSAGELRAWLDAHLPK